MIPNVRTSIIAALAWLTFLASASAELVPSFSLAYSSANATHVVVVDAADTVLESWRGDLAAGATIDGAATGKPENVADPLPRDAREPTAVAVTGNRRVLFLTHAEDGKSWIASNEPEPDLRLATIWIEKDQCFAVYQFQNPGSGAQMLPLYLDEATLKARVTRREAIAHPVRVATSSPASGLAGEWHVFLPAGFEHRITLSHVGANRYRLEPASLNFGGMYEEHDRCLTSVDPDDAGKGKFVWRVRSRYLITLVEQTANHGSDYTGAVLFRRRSTADKLIEDVVSNDAGVRAIDSFRHLDPDATAMK